MFPVPLLPIRPVSAATQFAVLNGIGLDWEPSETDWAKLLAQLVTFKEELGGCTDGLESWGKKMNKKFGIKEAPNWWSEELAHMGGQPADLREGLQEARVAALQGREEIRQQNYKAPRRAAGRHRLLYVVVF